MSNEAAQNTDREVWRGKSRAEFGDDDNYYADSLFVPQSDVEALGINCGGHVIVKPIREWHALAQQKGEKMPTFGEEAIRLASHLLAVNPSAWDYRGIREQAQRVLQLSTSPGPPTIESDKDKAHE